MNPGGLRTRSRFGLVISIVGLVMSLASAAVASPAALDTSFGQGGTVITPAPVNVMNGRVLELAQDRQGKLVAVGQTFFESFAVLRYDENGSLDPSFGADGFVETRLGLAQFPKAIAIQKDGKIIAAGTNAADDIGTLGAVALVRYEGDGSRDFSFGRRGRVTTRLGRKGGVALDLDLQRDGKIIAVGVAYRNARHHAGIILRYKPNGAPDRSFGRRGRVRFDARGADFTGLRDVQVLRSGMILVAGDFKGKFLLARLRPNGELDRKFGGGDGRVTTNIDRRCRCAYADSLVVRPDGRIVVQGNVSRSRDYVALARYHRKGKLDRRFGRKGIVRTKLGPRLEARDLVLQEDGRIVLAGTSGRVATFTVLRYLSNGARDPTLGDGGVLSLFGPDSAGYAALRQRDGRIVVGGQVGFDEHQRFALGRILPGS